MRDQLPEISDAGVRTVLIGNGTPEEARDYQEQLGGGCELLVHPQLVGYKAMELKRSLLAVLNPASLLNAFRLQRLGFRSGPQQGDPLQLGGVFVITPGQRVAWSYRSTAPDDFPRIDDLVAAARAV